MSTEARKKEILDLLKQTGSVKVTELSALFGVSEVTVRNYLEDMEKKGLLSRVHGGAVSSYKPYYSMNFNQRLETNHSEKVKIAEKIASMIAPNDTIMLNSGTTTLLTFRKFPQNYTLSIVTNSISIALEASDNTNYNVILVGGSINTKYQFTYGADAVRQIERYHADKLILSVDGIDLSGGFSTYYDKEAEIDRAMVRRSDQCIIAADSSKFYHNAFSDVFDISRADCIVTNKCLDDEHIREFSERGVDIVF